MAFDINAELIAAGTKYKKELLAMPAAVLAAALKHMNIRTGIQGKIVGGLLNVSAGLRPYKTDKGASDGIAITPYEWETFLGDEVKEFDPHQILGTLYTELTSKGVKEYAFVKRVALEMAKKIGEGLYDNLFSADRNAAGVTTADLFNGFNTLVNDAIAAATMTGALGNLQDISLTPTTVDNVCDQLKAAWRNLDRHLKGNSRVKLYLPVSVIEMYEDGYKIENGNQPWKDDQPIKKLIGSHGKCQFVPLDNMEGGNLMHFTIKDNMNVG
ncbi:MAG: hypothetical protein HQ522_06515, partial [Bacteroidetes bacterium]|nr:hypothetical protein [Bacteroidota bacterium]